MASRVPASPSGRTRCRTSRSPEGDPLLVQFQVAYLAMHLFQGRRDHLRVVGRLGVLGRNVPPRVFEVRHIDVEDSVEEPQGFDRVVAARVVDQGHGQALFNGQGEGLQDLGGKMRRADKVEVMAADLLQMRP